MGDSISASASHGGRATQFAASRHLATAGAGISARGNPIERWSLANVGGVARPRLPFHLRQLSTQPPRRSGHQRGPAALEIKRALGVVGVPGLAGLEGVEQGGGVQTVS